MISSPCTTFIGWVKRRMAEQALWPMGDTMDDLAGLQDGLDRASATDRGDALSGTMSALFERDGLSGVTRHGDGTYEVP